MKIVIAFLAAALCAVGARATTQTVPVPTAGEGCTPYHLPNGTAASNNSTNVKTGDAVLCTLQVTNDGTGSATVVNYLKLYNLAAAPACASATGIVHVYAIPVSASVGGIVLSIPMNEIYSKGIGFCVVTGGNSDTANGNASTGINVEGSYK